MTIEIGIAVVVSAANTREILPLKKSFGGADLLGRIWVIHITQI
jgi:hypothetical protein